MAKTAKPTVKKDEKEKGPKRAQTAYMFFAAEERPKLKAEKPDIAQPDVLKVIGERWAKVSDKEKEKFEALAAADRERFESEGGKKAKDKSGPKKPSSSYIFFCNDQRAAVKAANPSLVAKEIVSELGAEWKKLDASEKKKYEDMAAADKKRYEAEKKCACA